MRKAVLILTILSVGYCLAAAVPGANAEIREPRNSAQAQPSKEEADAYGAWYNAKSDPAKAVPLAKTYLEKFPSGTYATYLKTWIRPFVFNDALKSKNVPEMIRIANEVLAADPNSLDYLYLLAFNIRADELDAKPAVYAHAAEVTDYSQRAIKLIEAGKVPSVVAKDTWNQKATLAYLYQNLALVAVNSKNPDQALEFYRKSSEADPSNPANFFACGSLHQAQYQAAATKFQAFPEADRAQPDKPEVKAALDEVNKQADAVIDCWAHFMALTTKTNPYGPATRTQIETYLKDLYKYRHPDAPDGLQKLIDQYAAAGASGAAPASSGSIAGGKP